jgi:hypothetical protein
MQDQMVRAETRLEMAQRQLQGSDPWLWAGCLGAVIGLMWASLFRSFFWPAGLGFIATQGFIFGARARRSGGVAAAQDELAERRKEAALNPDWFNAAEEASGERDDFFQTKSETTPFEKGPSEPR